MQALIDVILPVFFVIGSGYLLVWKGWFTQDTISGLLKYTQNFAIPCLLFRAIWKLDLAQGFDWRLLLSFYGGAAICFVLGFLVARNVFKRDEQDSIAIGFCCLFSNSVMLGLAITERAYGTDALAGNYAIVALHSPFCYGIGITAMEFSKARNSPDAKVLPRILRSMFSNALIIGIVLGFVFNLAGLSLPRAGSDALDMIVLTALPLALFSLGGVLVQYRPEGDLRIIMVVCAITLLVHPTLVWTFGTALSLPTDGFRSAVLTSAMAPGINTYVFANMYGRARRVAASSVLGATALSVLSVWVWLTVLP